MDFTLIFLRRKNARNAVNRRSTRRGVALLIVLAGIAILTVMVLSLFLNINTELHTSKVYASGSSVKLLSQSAVELVMAQIYQATSGSTPGSGGSGSTLCWASQPGMIRTYDATGAASQYYKLYSDSGMTGTGAFDHTSSLNRVPDGLNATTAWYKQKGVYVDLNQPIAVNIGGTAVNQYPILDGQLGANDLISYPYPANPAPASAVSLATLATPAATSTVNVLGPTVNGGPQVAGFWLNSNTPVDPSSPNQAPMPVKWLYVLRDGKMAVPDSDAGGSTVTFSSSTVQPAPGDPIVGRIAFWTDDETSKVNINTASEGSYNNPTATAPAYATSFNDTPRVCTPFDLNLAQSPCFQNEFQRYPGHPATVSLSTVFGNLTTSGTYPENIYSPSITVPGIAPRTLGGGSTHATITAAAGGSLLPLLGYRLYATPDEILLQPGRSVNSTLIDQPALKRAQFFITASSRAPDVNLFNLPRVCLWPINANYNPVTNPLSPYVTPYDQLIAFCTTIASQPYYFQRSDWTSPNELYSNPATDPAYVQRNWTLLNGYLKYFCSNAVPGFGSSGQTFATKYSKANAAGGTELDQILIEIFDYVRSTNIYDSSLTVGDQFNPTQLTPKLLYGFGEVVPTYNANNNTKGFGRYPIVSKAAILFIASADSTVPFAGQTIGPHAQVISPSTTSSYTYGPTVASGKVRVQAALLFNLFDPALGYPALNPDCQIKVFNSTLSWNTSSSGQTGSNTSSQMFPLLVGTTGATLTAGGSATQAVAWGGNMGILPYINSYDAINSSYGFSPFFSWVPTAASQTAATAPYPFPDFTVGANQILFTGTVEVQVLTGAADANPGTVVQDTVFDFSNGGSGDSVKTPNTVQTTGPIAATPATNPGPTPTWTSGSTRTEVWSNFNKADPSGSPTVNGRLDMANVNTTYTNNGNTFRFFVTSGDVMQSVQSISGDLRLVAAHHSILPTSNIPNTSLFGPHPLWGGQFAHSFEDGYGFPLWGATRGQLVASVSIAPGFASYWSSANISNKLTLPYTVQSGGACNDGYYDYANSTSGSLVNPIQTCEPEGFGSLTTAAPAGVIAGSTTSTSWTAGSVPGDFDNGIGGVRDGPYINKADEGGLLTGNGSSYLPYYMDEGVTFTATGTTYFSPAREMPSAVMLGSLSTGVIGNRPWQTLLFHPDPTLKHVGSAGIGGNGVALAGAPPDHLLLDLFTMPVVEPYAISEPLSTAGRINMNYLIVPFTYINRDTGIRAVLESQQMLAVPSADSGSNSTSKTATYKQMINNSHVSSLVSNFSNAPTLRFGINLDETMKGFINRFYPKAITPASNVAPDIFKSPSEICTLDLVPNDVNDANAKFGATMQTYWQNHQLTGDNSRERPYANIYPLLTTKSNTYTVHFRVQALQQVPGADLTKWQEDTGVVASEYRGSETIERYVDPTATIPDYANAANPTSLAALNTFYRFRVLSTKQFSP